MAGILVVKIRIVAVVLALTLVGGEHATDHAEAADATKCQPSSPFWLECLEATRHEVAREMEIVRLDEQRRVEEMARLLGSREKGAYDKYKEFCAKAKISPAIGMTQVQARFTTWCFPTTMNKTTTVSGVRIQEVYERNRYLYFENGILTTIQE